MNQPKPQQISGNMLLSSFMSGVINNMVIMSFIKSFTKEEAEKVLDELYNAQLEVFKNTWEPMLAQDIGGLIELKKVLKEEFDGFKKSILEKYKKDGELAESG